MRVLNNTNNQEIATFTANKIEALQTFKKMNEDFESAEMQGEAGDSNDTFTCCFEDIESIKRVIDYVNEIGIDYLTNPYHRVAKSDSTEFNKIHPDEDALLSTWKTQDLIPTVAAADYLQCTRIIQTIAGKISRILRDNQHDRQGTADKLGIVLEIKEDDEQLKQADRILKWLKENNIDD